MKCNPCKWLTVFAAFVVALVAVGVAEAQDTNTIGSVKVQPRFFNPFDVGPSRLALNPFGSFEVVQSNAASLDSPTAASSSPVLIADRGIPVNRVRPPFTPPPFRSPFFPPGRPPFDPPGPPFDPPGPPPNAPPFDPPGRPPFDPPGNGPPSNPPGRP